MRRVEGVPTVIALGSDLGKETLEKLSMGDETAIFRGQDFDSLNKPSFFDRFIRWICWGVGGFFSNEKGGGGEWVQHSG